MIVVRYVFAFCDLRGLGAIARSVKAGDGAGGCERRTRSGCELEADNADQGDEMSKVPFAFKTCSKVERKGSSAWRAECNFCGKTVSAHVLCSELVTSAAAQS